MCICFVIPQYSVSKPSKARVDSELLWHKPCLWWCRRKVPSATMSHDRNIWPVSDRRAERDRWGGRWEVQVGGGISNSHKIISLWIISVSKLKSVATDGHFETVCCFWVTVLFLHSAALVLALASLLPTAWPSFLRASLPVALLVLYLDLRIQQPKSLPSGDGPWWSWHRSFGKSFLP